ncbi:ATP phosphoribosyltransferase (ATP-PRTase) (ATP-PRT) [Xanthoria calcicola]
MRDHHGLGLRGLHITGSGPATWPIPTAKRPDREEHWNHFHLAEQYFEELERSRAKRGEQRGDIIALSGSVEAAYALGVADGIVDLVESGETMKAAGLEAIDTTVVESSAILIKSRSPGDPYLMDLISVRIRGAITAQRFVLYSYNIE